MGNREENYIVLQKGLEKVCQAYNDIGKGKELMALAKQRIPAWLLKLETIEDQINPSIDGDTKAFKILIDRWVDAHNKIFFEVTK